MEQDLRVNIEDTIIENVAFPQSYPAHNFIPQILHHTDNMTRSFQQYPKGYSH